MNLTLKSLCGCGIDLRARDSAGTLTLHSEYTSLTRRHPDGSGGVEQVIAHLRSAAVAIASDEEWGCTEVDFCAPSYYDMSLRLETSIELVDGSNLHPRMTFTLLSEELDGLDYCHFGVTLDLSLQQFLDCAEAGFSTTSLA